MLVIWVSDHCPILQNAKKKIPPFRTWHILSSPFILHLSSNLSKFKFASKIQKKNHIITLFLSKRINSTLTSNWKNVKYCRWNWFVYICFSSRKPPPSTPLATIPQIEEAKIHPPSQPFLRLKRQNLMILRFHCNPCMWRTHSSTSFKSCYPWMFSNPRVVSLLRLLPR